VVRVQAAHGLRQFSENVHEVRKLIDQLADAGRQNGPEFCPEVCAAFDRGINFGDLGGKGVDLTD